MGLKDTISTRESTKQHVGSKTVIRVAPVMRTKKMIDKRLLRYTSEPALLQMIGFVIGLPGLPQLPGDG